MGASVVSFSALGCRKLWAFWPPTDYNLSLFTERSVTLCQTTKRLDNPSLFDVRGLKGGLYTVTEPGEGVYMPPMTLHATYTLEGGVIIGISAVALDGMRWCEKACEVDAAVCLGNNDNNQQQDSLLINERAYRHAFESIALGLRFPEYRDEAKQMWWRLMDESGKVKLQRFVDEHAAAWEAHEQAYAEIREWLDGMEKSHDGASSGSKQVNRKRKR